MEFTNTNTTEDGSVRTFLNEVKNVVKECEFMHLKIFVNGNHELKKLYLSATEKHNKKLIDSPFLDAGFDLYAPLQTDDPEEIEEYGEVIRCFGPGWTDETGKPVSPVNKIDFKIQCSAKMYNTNNSNKLVYNTGFYLYPRSSLSKTQLRLANSVGIIDSGYRGNIIGMFDVTNIRNYEEEEEYPDADYYVEKYDRLLQICAPGLLPIFVEIVDKLEDLGEKTERGAGGFGSTGK